MINGETTKNFVVNNVETQGQDRSIVGKSNTINTYLFFGTYSDKARMKTWNHMALSTSNVNPILLPGEARLSLDPEEDIVDPVLNKTLHTQILPSDSPRTSN